MANRTVVINTADQDPNTKLQSLKGWQNGAPVISIAEPRIKVANNSRLTVDDGAIRAADTREYYFITDGQHKGMFVKKEDAQLA